MTRKALAVVPFLLLPSVALAQAPAGSEFRVNAYTTGHQYFPAAAFDREGDFVIVWSSYPGPAAGADVVGQRYAVGRVPVGGQFIVNTTTAGNQYSNQIGTPIAMRRDGRFVVVWSHSPTPGTAEVRGQRFEADGSKVGAEFVVSGGVSGHSYFANVAMAANGGFVVAWTALASNYPSPLAAVYARVFDAAATPLGPPIVVDNQIVQQQGSRVAMDAAGGFVVVWNRRLGGFPAYHHVFARRFGPGGQPLGGEFRVNTTTMGKHYAYSVASAPDGRFVVAWDAGVYGSFQGILAQRYEAGGAPIGGEFQVNSATTGEQSYAAVAVDHHFRLATSWQSATADGSGFGIRGQAFDEAGAPRGGEFSVNTYTTRSQQAANVAMDEVGNYLVTWHSDRQEVPAPFPNSLPGDDLGVYAQRYGGLHPRSLRADATGNGVLEPGEVAAVQPRWTNVTSGAQTFSTDLASPEGPPGGVPQILTPLATYTAPLGASVECATCPTIQVPNPSTRPAFHWDGAVTESVVTGGHAQRKRWVLHVGASFVDVALSSPFYRFIETLLHHGVTGGCTAAAYCPSATASRQEMAVFVLAAKEGAGYVPPACGAVPMFADVPASSPFCRWVEELARRGVVGGCGGGNYCPASNVVRDQMAVFVLRTVAPAFSPAPCGATPMFADVPVTSPFCRWVEELARRGIVSGCGGGNYCPGFGVTREQMGVFIGVTFGLALYGL